VRRDEQSPDEVGRASEPDDATTEHGVPEDQEAMGPEVGSTG
jgi:hypothetical protein